MVNRIHLMKNLANLRDSGLTGKGIKVAIYESIDTDHHLVVASIYKEYKPDAEIRFFSYNDGYEKPIREMLEWGADICNMSFRGWNPENVKEWAENYRSVRQNPYDGLYELYDTFFKKVLCVCASANTGVRQEGDDDETAYEYPAASKIWKDEVISVGAIFYDTIERKWRVRPYSTGNNRVDFAMPDKTYYLNTQKYGTSFSAPLAGVCAVNVLEQLPELIGKPRIVARLLRNQAFDIDTEGKDICTGYGVINPRLIMDKEIVMKFKDAESKFTVNDEVKEITGAVLGKPVPIENYVRLGKTVGPVYDLAQELVSQMEGCYVPEESSEQMDKDKSWTSDSSTIIVNVKH